MPEYPKILATATAEPEYQTDTEKSMYYADQWLAGQPERFRRKAKRIFQYARVDRRFSALSPEEMLQLDSFESKNDRYIAHAIELSEQALDRALTRAGMPARELDFILTVSCTGFMIPSLDAHLINRLGLRQDVVRLPVTEMGCAAGVSALIYARELLRSNPGKKLAIIAAEFPSCTFQRDDFAMANIVSTAIFGDGVACAIVGHDDHKPGPSLQASGMYHFYDAIHMMGYRVKDSGFQMVLDPAVPETIEEHMPAVLQGFLEENGLRVEDVDHFVFHPGGKKIVQLVEDLLHSLGKEINDTKEVLRLYGNMSSATVLYVLDRMLRQREINKGDTGLMLSFGPGFSAQRMLLKW